MSVSICSFNAKGLGAKPKRDQVFQWLKNNRFSICLLQETHCKQISDTDSWNKQWNGDIFLSGNSSNSLGVGILIDSNVQYTLLDYKEIVTGRIQMLKIEIENKIIVLMNIYAPNNDDTNFFNIIEKEIIDNNEHTLILGGDFNTIIDHKHDKLNGRTDTGKKTSQILKNLIESEVITDVWRLKHPDKQMYTWHSNTKPPIFCRLDYFFISPNLLNFVTDSIIRPGFKSDRSIVVLKLVLNKT